MKNDPVAACAVAESSRSFVSKHVLEKSAMCVLAGSSVRSIITFSQYMQEDDDVITRFRESLKPEPSWQGSRKKTTQNTTGRLVFYALVA